MPSAPPNQRPTQGRSENSEADTVPPCSLRSDSLACSWSPTTFGGWKVSSSFTPPPISPGPAEPIRPSKSSGASEVQIRRCSSGIRGRRPGRQAHRYGVDEDGGSPIVSSGRREPWEPSSPQGTPHEPSSIPRHAAREHGLAEPSSPVADPMSRSRHSKPSPRKRLRWSGISMIPATGSRGGGQHC